MTQSLTPLVRFPICQPAGRHKCRFLGDRTGFLTAQVAEFAWNPSLLCVSVVLHVLYLWWIAEEEKPQLAHFHAPQPFFWRATARPGASTPSHAYKLIR